MAKFEEKYAGLGTYQLTKESLMRSEVGAPCVLCGQTTKFVDPDSDLYFCSEECFHSRSFHGIQEEKVQANTD